MTTFKAGAEHALRRCAEVINAAPAGPEALRAALIKYGEQVDALTADQTRALQLSADRIRTIAAAQTLDGACEALNGILATCRPPRVTAHGGSPWHLHIDIHDDADWGEWFLASSAMAIAITVADTQKPPLAICQAPGCANTYPTPGRGRPRRYCSTTCSTRARVSAHRSRA